MKTIFFPQCAKSNQLTTVKMKFSCIVFDWMLISLFFSWFTERLQANDFEIISVDKCVSADSSIVEVIKCEKINQKQASVNFLVKKQLHAADVSCINIPDRDVIFSIPFDFSSQSSCLPRKTENTNE